MQSRYNLDAVQIKFRCNSDVKVVFEVEIDVGVEVVVELTFELWL